MKLIKDILGIFIIVLFIVGGVTVIWVLENSGPMIWRIPFALGLVFGGALRGTAEILIKKNSKTNNKLKSEVKKQ